MSEYIAVEHDSPMAKEFLNVNWCLTNICNFKCTYCPENLHNGTVPGIKSDKVIESITGIVNHYKNKNIFFEFTGGEVTYYKNFIDVAEHVKSHGCDLGIISNGKRELEYWEKLGPLLDHVCLSYHSENDYAERFLEVVEYLNKMTTVHVNIMMNPELFDHAFDVAKKVVQNKTVSVALQPLYKEMTGEIFKYSDSQKVILDLQMDSLLSQDKIRDHFKGKKLKTYRGEMRFVKPDQSYEIINTPDVLMRKLNNFQGWDCYAGLENLAIDFFGNVQRAWCHSPNTKIGNLTKDFSYPTKPIKCLISNCHCGFDIMCTKRKSSLA